MKDKIKSNGLTCKLRIVKNEGFFIVERKTLFGWIPAIYKTDQKIGHNAIKKYTDKELAKHEAIILYRKKEIIEYIK